ncbi:sulfite exporter TauE/SafE family protein [Numidum massiliense]|uniref:sulfite exporter TauE/SafE family protein n=1 Tax=Numidum massiliense TaxID=1522315 RepID=UPI0006D5AAF8|nr:sulfite exporter TauE/SafE family protein [Numidum massiliense]
MTIDFAVTLFAIGFVGSFVSGMLGIGGSIVNYPLLLYVPPLVGVTALTAHDVTGINAVQVFFATLSGLFVFRKGGYLNKALIGYMGVSIVAGSFIGGYGSNVASAAAINTTYAVLATLAALLMIVPQKESDDVPLTEVTFHKPAAVAIGFAVGLAAGVVGAGGAFILVPLMLVVLKIPTRMTIATSLAVTFLSSIGTTAGKLLTGQVLFAPAAVVVVASLLAAPLGATVSKKVNVKWLQALLVVLIVVTSLKIWVDVLGG